MAFLPFAGDVEVGQWLLRNEVDVATQRVQLSRFSARLFKPPIQKHCVIVVAFASTRHGPARDVSVSFKTAHLPGAFVCGISP